MICKIRISFGKEQNLWTWRKRREGGRLAAGDTAGRGVVSSAYSPVSPSQDAPVPNFLSSHFPEVLLERTPLYSFAGRGGDSTVG